MKSVTKHLKKTLTKCYTI